MGAFTGYKPMPDVLPALLDWLNDLDAGWLAVLRSQAWDADTHRGVDVSLLDDEDASMQSPDGDSQMDAPAPMTQTERTRLRSLLIAGTGRLEEWLVGLDTAGQDYTALLDTLGLRQSFDDLFAGTLTAMGSLGGVMNVPEGMEGTC
jgi:hypothetical protein